jgi:hypothetical protein
MCKKSARVWTKRRPGQARESAGVKREREEGVRTGVHKFQRVGQPEMLFPPKKRQSTTQDRTNQRAEIPGGTSRRVRDTSHNSAAP